MAGVKILGILLLLSTLCVAISSKQIYRKYEKKHPRMNYVQVVEIFETRRAPPLFSRNDKDLNDFLARDSYSTDMNCTKGTDEVGVVTRPATTIYPTIPTTAYRRAATTPTTRAPNLNNLFTIRVTKPTNKPNPRENNNPDYTNLLPWPNTSVQVTKHPPSTINPTIMIKETDDLPVTNRTTPAIKNASVEKTDDDLKTNSDEIIYDESGEEHNGVDADYREDNYPDVIPPEQFEPSEDANSTVFSEEEDYDADDNDTDVDDTRRRKRHKQLRLAPLRASK